MGRFFGNNKYLLFGQKLLQENAKYSRYNFLHPISAYGQTVQSQGIAGGSQ